MKEFSILLIFCLFSTISAFAQDNKDFNFILVIDDAVWVTYTNLKIEIRDTDGSLNHTVSGCTTLGIFLLRKRITKNYWPQKVIQ